MQHQKGWALANCLQMPFLIADLDEATVLAVWPIQPFAVPFRLSIHHLQTTRLGQNPMQIVSALRAKELPMSMVWTELIRPAATPVCSTTITPVTT